MASIVDSQLKTFNSKTSSLESYNPFLPISPLSANSPIGIKKNQITSSQGASPGGSTDFLLSKQDFIGEIFLTATLNYDGSDAGAPAPAMSAIKTITIVSPSGQIAFYDYATVVSHLMSVNGHEWMSSLLDIGGGYSTGSGTSHSGLAWIPTPWSQGVTGISNSPPFPSFLLGGQLKVRITWRTASELQTNVNLDSFSNVSLLVEGMQTVAPLKSDLESLPAFQFYSRDFQVLTNQSVTTSPTTIDISNFSGTVMTLAVKCQLDSSTASGTSNYWNLSSLTDIELKIDNDVVWKTFTGFVEEVKASQFKLGLWRGENATQSLGATNLGSVWAISLSGLNESMHYYLGGADLSGGTPATLTLTSESASSHADILAEVQGRYQIKNGSIRLYHD